MIDKILELLKYTQNEPLLFSSGLFLFVFLFFSLGYYFLRKNITGKIIYVILFSWYFYYKSSGFFFLLLIFTTTSDFLLGKYIAQASKQSLKKLFVVLSVVIDLGFLVYFKYTNFFAETFCSLTGQAFHKFDIFLPIGISFFTFQSLTYTIDIYRGNLKPVKNWIDYAFFVSFFPLIMAGPITRAKALLPQIRKPAFISKKMLGQALFLIAIGLFKKAVISDYISTNFVDRIFDNPSLYSGMENLLGAYGYTLQIYCDFSGYSDMAIGLALLLGFQVGPNFDSPYKSRNITEFWRRWHISLSSWLRDYLYISLGGNRKGKFRAYLNQILTMLLGGLWHGASLRYIIWGALHGVALVVHKMYMQIFNIDPKTHRPTALRKIISIVFTFHFVTFCWIFFKADSMETALAVVRQIVTNLHPELLLNILRDYHIVMSFMALGFVLHFVPLRLEQKVQSGVVKSPFIVQILLLVLIIIIVFQVKSADVQPFIYYQY